MRVVGAKQMQAADDRLDARWIDGLANVLQRVDNARARSRRARPAWLVWKTSAMSSATMSS